MITDTTIRLATRDDAAPIAEMSRDLIECGLGWSWTPQRVRRSIRDSATNVVLALQGGRRVGFGIMKYHDDEAHLLLLAVPPLHARQGVGGALVAWLECVACAAGITQIYLEARFGNTAAQAFYRRLGYREIQTVPGYYQGREAGVRMVKSLRREPTPL